MWRQVTNSVLFGLVGMSGQALAQRCPVPFGEVISIEGRVEILASSPGIQTVSTLDRNATLCIGDAIRTGPRSEALLRIFEGDGRARIEANSTVELTDEGTGGRPLLDLRGIIYFFLRLPAPLDIRTQFVTAGVEGTQFVVDGNDERTRLSVLEGLVRVTNLGNPADQLLLAAGEVAEGRANQPLQRIQVDARDAVVWAIYYQPASYAFLDADPGLFAGSRDALLGGDLDGAITALDAIPEADRDERFYVYRAGLLLTSGDLAEAETDLATAEQLAPESGESHGLRAIIAVAANEREAALESGRRATELSPNSPSTWVARSYAEQADTELEAARDALLTAVALDPDDRLAQARLSELWLSLGDADRAVAAAEQAIDIPEGPTPRPAELGRAYTVLGFARLAQIRIPEAMMAFATAVEQDSTSSLAFLGRGLARIRDGNLEEGRRDLETAATLDPNSALVHSYLGKAYFEEKRDADAAWELELAKQLDPDDPTAFLYDAIRKQTTNRPVDALRDLQRSIELNDNRAVYRSRLLLDEDLAARSSSLARIYRDLGFEQLALVEGWKSLDADGSDYSGHRFLADAYSTLPRHEIARVSELLQSQLLQPLNVTPLQPQLAETDLFIQSGAGPSDFAFNEFNRAFTRDGVSFQANGIAGGNDTLGDDLVVSGIVGKFSFSAGQFRYQTDGFHENNDQTRNIYNLFLQTNLSHRTSVQGELRYRDAEWGDLDLRFDPDNINPTVRQQEETHSARFGLHHAFSTDSDLIASLIYRNEERSLRDFPSGGRAILRRDQERDGYIAEVQHLFRSEAFSFTGGLGYFNADGTDERLFNVPPIFVPPPTITESDSRHGNVYLYSQVDYPLNVRWTLGGSVDLFDDRRGDGISRDRNQFNPKLGVSWNIFPNTGLRAAVFRAMKRTLLSDMTIEPTQVAGFNQFFDDQASTDSWRYGVALDHTFSDNVHGGIEVSRRDLDTPTQSTSPGTQEIGRTSWDEAVGRLYLYWTPRSWLGASADLKFEQFERPDFVGPDLFTKLNTLQVPLGINFFHPRGFKAGLVVTAVDQNGRFGNSSSGPFVRQDSQFWLADVSVGYRLPDRWGLLTLVVKNVFDKQFNFQDTDTASPRISPSRLILFRLTLAL